ncbi:beta-lactamase/transpeptidase-like protein [Cyathus striatus]|nr:beta-lactamase/transpeptidase-like protein [Cyathus striatus]
MKLPYLLTLPLVHVPQFPVCLTTSDASLISYETKAFVSSLLSHWSSVGLSLAVVRQTPNSTDPWYTEFASFGTATADGKAVDENTIFAIASNSKLILAISVGLLIHNETLQTDREKAGLKKLEWRSKVGDILGDEWGLWDEDMSRAVTVQDMLSHRTGMPRHEFSGAARDGGVPEMIRTLRYLLPSATHRETYQYNNLMFEALSHLPQHLLNVSYESYISDNIFKPLNMSSTTFSISEAESWSADPKRKETFAHGFQWHARDVVERKKGELRATVPYFSRPGEEKIWAGAGGVLTTTKDLSTWAATLLNRGRHPYTNESVIPTAILDHVERGITVAEGKPSDPELSPKIYGSGLFRYHYQGHELLEHGGSCPGFKTQLARFPQDNLAVISLSNDDNGEWVIEAAKWRVAEDILRLKKVDWSTRFIRSSLFFGMVTPRPEPVTLPKKPIERLGEKTFHHPSYGTLRLCVVPSSLDLLLSFRHHHDDCAAALKTPTANMILSRSNLSIPTIIVPWNRFFATHLRLTHFQEDIFNVTMVWGNAEVRKEEGFFSGGEGEEDDGAVLLLQEVRFQLEWVHEPEEGLAFRGGFWGKEGLDAREPEEKEGKGSAEVWFEAV